MIDKETILRIARESGIKTRPYVIGSPESEWFGKLEVLEAFANSVATATVSRLAAGVSVEPAAERRRIRYSWGECWDYRDDEKVAYTAPGFDITLVTPAAPLFTLDQLTTAIAAARVQENERCVQACAAKSKEYLARSNRDQHSHGAGLGAAICAELISALLGKEQS